MALSETSKTEIIQAAEKFMAAHNLSQNVLAKQAQVNALYLIEMRKGGSHVMVGEKEIEIKDLYYQRLANYMGFELEAAIVEAKPTLQFEFILSHLNDAKNNAETSVIIGETGAGKTFTLERFKTKNPNEVFSIKVGSEDRIDDVLTKINDEINAYTHLTTKSAKISQICARLKKIKNSGAKPVLVFDESEYLKERQLCSVKEIVDALDGICPIVLIGTQELLDKINRMVLRRKPGIAQLYRRIKFKTHYVPAIDKQYPLFIDTLSREVKSWLKANCNNYGELTDVLRPVYRESDRLNQPITVQFIEMVLGL